MTPETAIWLCAAMIAMGMLFLIAVLCLVWNADEDCNPFADDAGDVTQKEFAATFTKASAETRVDLPNVKGLAPLFVETEAKR